MPHSTELAGRTLTHLRVLMGEPKLAMLLEAFKIKLETAADSLRTAPASLTEEARRAHGLAGSAGMLGWSDLAAAAQKLEQAALTEPLASVAARNMCLRAVEATLRELEGERVGR